MNVHFKNGRKQQATFNHDVLKGVFIGQSLDYRENQGNRQQAYQRQLFL